MENNKHWDEVYMTKSVDAVSWYQEHANRSVELIAATKVNQSAAIIDVGSGASRLIDDLIDLGFTNITALDLSAPALSSTKARLNERANQVNFMEADITQVELPRLVYDVWHDRAVFHFLTQPEQRRAYVQNVLNSLKPGGHIIIATFAEDGPTKCSGLPVQRYSPDELHAEFGTPFELVHSEREVHSTPFATEQKFIYCYCRKANQ